MHSLAHQSSTAPLAGENKAFRRVLLISNPVMHYRISVYNYFCRRFMEFGWEWSVLTNKVQTRNCAPPQFNLEEIPFHFTSYRRRIRELEPSAIILFLHLKDPILWPLAHWLKWSRIPFATWTKTRNLDAPNNPIRNAAFDYVHTLSDGLILYSSDLMRNLSHRQQQRAFVANNTINPEEYPVILETAEEIKRDLDIPFHKVVLFAGRMDVEHGRKRVELLIDIFRDSKRTDVGLVIVGSGMKPEWQARINRDTTIYLGEVHDPGNHQIARIFSMADVFSIPGHVGLGLNQAFYHGLPVVTMDGKQPPEITYLQNGRNGFMVPSGDIKQLRERIFQLLDDDSLRESFSVAAREDFHRRASIEGMFQGFKHCVEFISNVHTD
jgi:glycosyltransferase involved in cell wall biosynthesis